jgi:hypothetical protein
LNWVGIYSREVKPLDKEEEKEAEKGKVEKKKSSKKDSIDDAAFQEIDPSNAPHSVQVAYKQVLNACNEVTHPYDKIDGYKIMLLYAPHTRGTAENSLFTYMIRANVQDYKDKSAKNKVYDKLYEKGYRLNDRANNTSIVVYL